MKNSVSLFTGLLLIISTVTFAKQVDEQTAKQVGQAFLSGTSGTKIQKSLDNLELVYKVGTTNSSGSDNHKKLDQTTYFYVFNAGTNGFVIVAGDDNVSPILGYSNESTFDPNNIPPNARKWFEGYKEEIRYVIEQNIAATEQIQQQWTDYYNNTPKLVHKAGSVNPLLSTQWDQGTYYNTLCPGSGSTKAVTGCVATAMAQIMNFWKYPITGTGFHSYNSQNYGTLSANFGSTTYDWSNMPNKLTSSSSQTQKTAVATLMYHCGVSVDMDYSSSGSGAYVISAQSPVQHCSEYAFKTYFGYKNSLRGLQRSSYTQARWIDTLKKELNAGRPVLYTGYGTAGGHAFVCDGFDNNDYFHFNWGWSGVSDGYFAVNALNPSALGTGGGNGGFNSGQQIIVGLEPPDGNWTGDTTSTIKLYSTLSMPSSYIWFYNSISLTAKIANYDITTFNGTLGAAVFNSEGVLLAFLDTMQVSLLSMNFVEKTFTNAGGPPFIPGKYSVSILYKKAGGNWTIVGDGDSYGQINYKDFEVYYQSNIEVYSKFSVLNNGGRLIKDESASIHVNVANFGSTTFYGKFKVSLGKLNGNIVQDIQINDKTTNGLQSLYYDSIIFTNKITVEPGTYLLMLAYQKKGESTWYYAGSSYFQNPAFVIVEAPLVYADKYEPNNTCASAAKLPVSFSGNKATVKTTGSNFHIGTDQDYYKIDLPAGYSYTVKARLHDANNSGDGNIYYVDGLFSYSTDNCSTWSDTYDDIMTSSITMPDGGSICFLAAPYFEGKIGTYLLEVNIDRTPTVSITTITNNELRIFPNPTTGQLIIASPTPSTGGEQTTIEIYDIVGKRVQQSPMSALSPETTIDISHLSNGMYFLKIDGKTVKIIKQ